MDVLISALHRPTRPTGVCRHAVNLALCLAGTSKISKVTLLIGAWQHNYFKTVFPIDSEKINFVEVNIKNTSLSRNIWFLFGLPKLVKSLRPDIVHLSFPLPFIRPLFPCPVLSTIHDLYPYECPENFGYPQVVFNQLFLKQCVNSCDGLSCVSNVTREKLKLYFPNAFVKKVVSTIYNYVDFSGSCPEKPKEIDIDQAGILLLTVAQHRKNKNLDILIYSYSRLLRDSQLPDSSRLVIVGSSGPETDSLIKLIQELSLDKNVFLVSSISDNQLCWFYQNCTAYVAASSTEGFCLPLVEALHFTSRVVCSNIPIFKEVGSSTCTYFELEGDLIENLRLAILAALKKSSSEEFMDGDHSKLLKFSKARVAEQYLEFYCALQQN